MSGDGASARASAARRASPPDKDAGIFVAGKAEFLQQIQRPVTARPPSRVEPRLDIGQGRGETGQIGFLRQVLDRCAGLGKPLAGIGLHQPGGDAQQGRFARTVAPDEADPVAGRDRQSRAGKQRRRTEGQADVL